HLEASQVRHQRSPRACTNSVGCLRTARQHKDERREDRDESMNTQSSHTPPPSPFGSIADQEPFASSASLRSRTYGSPAAQGAAIRICHHVPLQISPPRRKAQSSSRQRLFG